MAQIDYEFWFWLFFPFALIGYFVSAAFIASRFGRFSHDVDEDARRSTEQFLNNPMKDFRAKNGRRTP